MSNIKAIENPNHTRNDNNFLELIMEQLKPEELSNLAHNEHLLIKLIELGIQGKAPHLQNSLAILTSALHSYKALRASLLVGRTVYISQNPGYFDNQQLKAAVELPSSVSELKINIFNFASQLVRTILLGSQQAGVNYFSWDGYSDDGIKLAEGSYTLKASAIIDDKLQSLTTMISANIDSVSLINQGSELKLSIAGIGLINLKQVNHIV